MTPPTPPRPSAGATLKVVEVVAGSVSRLVVCVILAGPGLYWFWTEMQDAKGPGATVHIGHVSFAVGLMVAGAIALAPTFGEQITKIYIQVFPNGIPLVGGLRGTDPPKPPSPPPVA